MAFCQKPNCAQLNKTAGNRESLSEICLFLSQQLKKYYEKTVFNSTYDFGRLTDIGPDQEGFNTR